MTPTIRIFAADIWRWFANSLLVFQSYETGDYTLSELASVIITNYIYKLSIIHNSHIQI